MPELQNDFLTLAEAATLLKVAQETVRRAIRKRELKAAKLGRVFRISRRDLEAFYRAKGGGKGLFEEDAL